MTMLVLFKVAALIAGGAFALSVYLAIAGLVAAAEYEYKKKRWTIAYRDRKPELSALAGFWPITIPYLILEWFLTGIYSVIVLVLSNPFAKGVRFFYWLNEPADPPKEKPADLPEARVINE